MANGYVKISIDKIRIMCSYRGINLKELSNAVAELYPKLAEAQCPNHTYLDPYLRGKRKASPELVDAMCSALDAPLEDVIESEDYDMIQTAMIGLETERMALRYADFDGPIPPSATKGLMQAWAILAPYILPKKSTSILINPTEWMEAFQAHMEAIQAGDAPDIPEAVASIMAGMQAAEGEEAPPLEEADDVPDTLTEWDDDDADIDTIGDVSDVQKDAAWRGWEKNGR